MTKLLQQYLDSELAPLLESVRMVALSGTGDVNALVQRYFNSLISRYFRARSRGKAELSEALQNKYKEELKEAEAVMRDRAGKVFFEYRKRRDVARIEFPALEIIVKEGMAGKGIPYLFRNVNGENLLTVRVVYEYFLEIPLTMENAQQVMGLLKYFINRPDCAVQEMPGLRRTYNYRLAKKWDKVAVKG
ncbi:MAG: hypothetical protein J6Y66_07770 [Bacteroidales bacterium]|nr:hypothetical protein [Bacteroidales bacterium]